MKIGVLALQGDFAEHIRILEKIGVIAVEVRLPGDLADIDGLIIPGGESTTIGKLAVRFGLMAPSVNWRQSSLYGEPVPAPSFLPETPGFRSPCWG